MPWFGRRLERGCDMHLAFEPTSVEQTHSVVEHTSRYAVKQTTVTPRTTAVLTPAPHHTVTLPTAPHHTVTLPTAPHHTVTPPPSYTSTLAPHHTVTPPPSYPSTLAPHHTVTPPPSYTSTLAPHHTVTPPPSYRSTPAPHHRVNLVPPCAVQPTPQSTVGPRTHAIKQTPYHTVKPTTRFNFAATPQLHRAVEPVSRFTAEPTQHSTIEARRPVPHCKVGSTTHYDFTATPVADHTVESTNSHTSTHPTVNPLYTDFSDGHLPHTSFSIPNTHTHTRVSPQKIVAFDCEMIGCEPSFHTIAYRRLKGKKKRPKEESVAGRCTIVGYHGNILYDKYIRPNQRILDLRTRFSGITPENMKTAVPIHRARREIRSILEGKIVVAHDIKQDLEALSLSLPKDSIRDTSCYPGLRIKAGLNVLLPPSLKLLSLHLLGERIQTGAHCSLVDARTTMKLYQLVETEWEKSLEMTD